MLALEIIGGVIAYLIGGILTVSVFTRFDPEFCVAAEDRFEMIFPMVVWPAFALFLVIVYLVRAACKTVDAIGDLCVCLRKIGRKNV